MNLVWLLAAIAALSSAHAQLEKGMIHFEQDPREAYKEVAHCRDAACFRRILKSHVEKAESFLRETIAEVNKPLLKKVYGACRGKLQPHKTVCIHNIFVQLQKQGADEQTVKESTQALKPLPQALAHMKLFAIQSNICEEGPAKTFNPPDPNPSFEGFGIDACNAKQIARPLIQFDPTKVEYKPSAPEAEVLVFADDKISASPDELPPADSLSSGVELDSEDLFGKVAGGFGASK